MDERNVDRMDEVMLPGFRFHPTDEELVGFYLKRKIQQRPLSIELIKQRDIYKYDPWDLPKLANGGEKEWYFYCPRDRKYRNSARPNRVTEAGFWKATGTDRPIYSSHGNKCIGLKKSLVFYKGRASRGIKTDWMMHEFRLPSLANSTSTLGNKLIDKTIPTNDSWAICRIFKKTNSTTKRAVSQSWLSSAPELTSSCLLAKASKTSQLIKSPTTDFPPSDFSSHKLLFNTLPNTLSHHDQLPISNGSSHWSPFETFSPSKFTVDHGSSMLLNLSSSLLGDSAGGGLQDLCNGFSSPTSLPQQVMQMRDGDENGLVTNRNFTSISNQYWEINGPIGFSLSLPLKQNLVWDSSSCTSDQMSTSIIPAKCYT